MMYMQNIKTGEIATGENLQPGYKPATEEQIKVFLLAHAKIDKIGVLKEKLALFRSLGFVHNTWVFKFSKNSVFEVSNKNSLPLTSGTGRFKFSDIKHVVRDFVNDTGFRDFAEKLCLEENRVMELYNNYYHSINLCDSISGPELPKLNDIVIDFTAP